MTKRYYVYALCKPDGTPFYIGKGQGNRLYNHKSAALSGKPTKKYDAIRKMLKDGEEIGYQILFECDNSDDALAEEKRQIEIHKELELVNSYPVPRTNGAIDKRISIQVVTPEEHELFRQLNIMAAIQDSYVREIVIQSLQRTVREYFAKSPPPEKK